jgi:hypothetical protein
MQVPAQSFWPSGQAPPQVVPSQVAVPPAGAMHAEHEPPQLIGDVSSRHAAPQR